MALNTGKSAAGIRRAYVETADGQLHYKACGDGPSLVFLQILPFSTMMLDGLLTAMATIGYRAHAFDLMGYGRSDPRSRAWSVEDFAGNLMEGLTALHISPVGTVAGHFTGMVATEIALRDPRLTGRLILDGVPLWSRQVAAERLRNRRPPEPWQEDGKQLLQAWTGAIVLLKKFDPELTLSPDNQERIFRAFSHYVEVALGPDVTSAILQYDMAQALTRLDVSTLIIGSPTDTLRQFHEAAVAAVRGAKAHIFEDIHPLYDLGNPQKAEVYARVIEPFLRS